MYVCFFCCFGALSLRENRHIRTERGVEREMYIYIYLYIYIYTQIILCVLPHVKVEVFAVIPDFFCSLIIRLCIQGRGFFRDAANWFDMVLAAWAFKAAREVVLYISIVDG